MTRKFSELRDELEAQERQFGEEELKQLKYSDLDLAGVGNAGRARCEDWELIKAEAKRRLARFDGLNFKELAKATFEDESEMYAAFGILATNRKDELEMTLPVRLYKAMSALRGDWSEGRNNPHLADIYSLLTKCKSANTLPIGFLLAVKRNADTFDGEYNDGRIMRDGQLLLNEGTAKEFNLPKTKGDPSGHVSASGNIARMLGAVPQKRGDWYGSYGELWKKLLSPKEKASALFDPEE